MAMKNVSFDVFVAVSVTDMICPNDGFGILEAIGLGRSNHSSAESVSLSLEYMRCDVNKAMNNETTAWKERFPECLLCDRLQGKQSVSREGTIHWKIKPRFECKQ